MQTETSVGAEDLSSQKEDSSGTNACSFEEFVNERTNRFEVSTPIKALQTVDQLNSAFVPEEDCEAKPLLSIAATKTMLATPPAVNPSNSFIFEVSIAPRKLNYSSMDESQHGGIQFTRRISRRKKTCVERLQYYRRSHEKFIEAEQKKKRKQAEVITRKRDLRH